MAARIPPLEPPYEAETQELLESLMPRGTGHPPLALFRMFARKPDLVRSMMPWGGYELGRGISVPHREREIVILRVCARCRCEYEWGVHATLAAPHAGLTEAEIAATASPDLEPWSPRDRLLVRLVDALHDRSDVPDDRWAEAAAAWSPEQLLDLILLTGWYHAISFAANAARVPLEPWAARFTSVLPGKGATPGDS
ncbi:carboxymuconolactone decarboxylase family protein [Amycolatopsis anabasis]|uniref:carboxymuconolactone decarboxylase family protein n=1 Tax=Amycolatopsis anabasis TaxID=1840409 RepID=UPI00131A98DB|nr:carboxymuconolactone decarboxylase family protein [Amycolatopsis anabasis]